MTTKIRQGTEKETIQRMAARYAKDTFTKDHLVKRISGLNAKCCEKPLGLSDIELIVDKVWQDKIQHKETT